MTNEHQQVGDPDDFDGTYGLAVSNECFATSNKVHTNTDQRALASRGAK